MVIVFQKTKIRESSVLKQRQQQGMLMPASIWVQYTIGKITEERIINLQPNIGGKVQNLVHLIVNSTMVCF